jgi:hypothetical protein
MESVILSKEHLLVLGDFNIHLDISDDADAIKFLDLLESLEQHVTKSTHIHGHTLDLVITCKTENIIPFSPCSCSYFSDHTSSVHFDIAITNPPLQTKSISYRKTKAVDIDCFKHELASSVLCYNELREHSVPEDLDRLVNVYNTTLTSMIDKHAPLITKTGKAISQVPWYNHENGTGDEAEVDLLLFKRLKTMLRTSAIMHVESSMHSLSTKTEVIKIGCLEQQMPSFTRRMKCASLITLTIHHLQMTLAIFSIKRSSIFVKSLMLSLLISVIVLD